eukprot:scaffold11272_cov42-Phaeocystis_antarctica.AAC.1
MPGDGGNGGNGGGGGGVNMQMHCLIEEHEPVLPPPRTWYKRVPSEGQVPWRQPRTRSGSRRGRYRRSRSRSCSSPRRPGGSRAARAARLAATAATAAMPAAVEASTAREG